MIEGPRAAAAAELPAVIALSNAVFAPEGGGDMGGSFPTFFSPDNAANLRICLYDGKPVSLVGLALHEVELGGARVRAACVGSVCTLAEYRGQGLAVRLMEDAVAHALSQGVVVMLISGGRGLYRRLGCIDAGLFLHVKVDRRSRLPRLGCDVRAWSPADVPAMAALQRAERVRHVRSERDTGRILASGRVFGHPGNSWVVTVRGKVTAWMAAAHPDKSSGGATLAVWEIAGSRLGVLAAMPAVLRVSRTPGAVIETVGSDLEMETLARTFGVRTEPCGFHGTVKIIDPPGLFRSLDAWISERLSIEEKRALRIEAGERTVFSLGRDSLTVRGVEDLAALVFGSMERTPPPAPAGALADVLARLFPVPLPFYGLSYT